MFSCEFYEISKNTFYYRTPLVAASVFSFQALTSPLTLVLLQLLRGFSLGIFGILWIYLRYYFHYCEVVAAETAVIFCVNFGTYNDGIPVVMDVGIVYAAVVTVIVVVVVDDDGVNRNYFY